MNKNENPRVSIILPCQNEEESIGNCLSEIKAVIAANGLDAEVIVVDNNSTDASVARVRAAMGDFPGLRLIEEKEAGYGKALLAGMREARGKYIYMADADGTYDFSEIPDFIRSLEEGSDLVVGDRFTGLMNKGAMPWHRKYIGNPILSFLVRRFFGVSIHDIHCGARAISREALGTIVLYTAGMEFASEMVVKAAKQGLRISEIPAHYSERTGVSKLRSMSDAWRHVRFILLYSPLVLFFLPGTVLFGIGIISMIILYFISPSIFGVQLFVHPLFLSSLLAIIGYQLVIFALFSKIYALTHLGENNLSLERLFRIVTLEKAGVVGLVLTAIGAAVYMYIFTGWVRSGFGSLDQIKNSVVALTCMVIGIQTIFSAFMLSTLGIKER